jgi:pyruvate/2-oxoglutarate dehydrogenase complex dihydrolipoamide acyltransferase (E2) component
MSDPPELPILVPELGNGDLAVRLGCWLVDVGDEIIQGDRLAELILPGTVFELTATASGRLTRIERANGATVECGTVLGMFTPEIQETNDDS